jgi:hypothetical protein
VFFAHLFNGVFHGTILSALPLPGGLGQLSL